MRKKTVIIIVSVSIGVIVATGLSVLIWWLVTNGNDEAVVPTPDESGEVEEIGEIEEIEEISVIRLEGEGFGNIKHSAAFTSIPGTGNVFWWFYPSTSNDTSRPIILWLDGVTGVPPSLLANFGMFGPYDVNFNERTDSWVDEYNLLFVDPLGTGFSTLQTDTPLNFDENGKYLASTLETFFEVHTEYKDNPLYIFGQGSGAQLAISLAVQLAHAEFCHNLHGIAIGNGIVHPSRALTKLGFYLEEWAYIDDKGRIDIENLTNEINDLVNAEKYDEAFDKFITLEEFINDAGAVAINSGNIVEKLTNDPTSKGYIKQESIRSVLPSDISSFMDGTVAQGLGIESSSYDEDRSRAVQGVRHSFMEPLVDKIEYLLNNTNINIAIYNGNLDAVSNTPGQLEWVNNLKWGGQEEFTNSARRTLTVNFLLEGYYRETGRLQFYWMNAAGLSVPLDSPIAMRRILDRIIETSS